MTRIAIDLTTGHSNLRVRLQTLLLNTLFRHTIEIGQDRGPALARPAAQRLHHLKVALRLGQIAREHTVDHHVAKVNGILILRAIEVLHFGAVVEGLARVFQPVARAVPQEPLESKVALQFPLALANCLGDLCHKGKVDNK